MVGAGGGLHDVPVMQRQAIIGEYGSEETATAILSLPINSRLVAAVQTHAGARCHESANLLSNYYLSADVYRRRLGRGDRTAADAAWLTLKQAEIRLREFLTDGFYPSGRGCAALAG
jgi:hypothetical protein